MYGTRRALALLPVALAALAFQGCSDDETTAPTDMTETFTVNVENVAAAMDFSSSASFSTASRAPIGPGEAYEVRFGALPGGRVSFATMFVHSNDLFYAPGSMGIALFDGDIPVSGDVTAQVMLWDAGTEMNEEPGTGPNQAPRQGGANTGPADADDAVRIVADGFTYPAVADVIAVTLTPMGGNEFVLRIENVSDENTLDLPLGESTSVPLAPGAFAVHTGDDLLFEPGMPATAGLEALAEDGDPSALAAHLGMLAGVSASGAFSVPIGAGAAGPLLPGASYSFEFSASPGDRLSMATMLVQSNDLVLTFADGGLALFSGGTPVTGDVSAGLYIVDAGTEANQWPGVGPDQAPRQAGPNTGAADADDSVRMVSDGFSYPAVTDLLRVTLSVSN